LQTEISSLQEKAELDDENRIVESMITSAHKGDRAVLGIDETLAAIQQGRVHRMVVGRDYHVAGRECGSCSVLIASEVSVCPFCGGNTDLAPDLINRASHRVLEQGGKVQPVSGAAAEKLGSTGVGAILRF
jgi:peptide subunit release factor 1 (eRF1)